MWQAGAGGAAKLAPDTPRRSRHGFRPDLVRSNRIDTKEHTSWTLQQNSPTCWKSLRFSHRGIFTDVAVEKKGWLLKGTVDAVFLSRPLVVETQQKKTRISNCEVNTRAHFKPVNRLVAKSRLRAAYECKSCGRREDHPALIARRNPPQRMRSAGTPDGARGTAERVRLAA